MKSFRQYVTEEVKEAVFTFGRFNPPTTGHEKLLDAVAKVAGRNKYFVYASHSNDAKKNPLAYKDKLKIARKMFPKHARNILKSDKNFYQAYYNLASIYYDLGEYDKAEIFFKDTLKIENSYFPALLGLANLFREKKAAYEGTE